MGFAQTKILFYFFPGKGQASSGHGWALYFVKNGVKIMEPVIEDFKPRPEYL